MNRRTSLIAAVAACAALATCAAAPIAARADGGDNTAVAVNTRDDSSVYRFSFKVLRVETDVVDNGNAAVAASSCTDCRTVAVAIEVLFYPADATVVSPTNLALALNVDCNDCETLADAFQYVFGEGDPVKVHFTPEGNQKLAQVRREGNELRRSDLSLPELQARIEQLAAEVADVLANDVVTAGN
jgi:putative peptide zinc metalloprotease protein